MVYNDTTDKLGLCQEIDALCDSDTTSYPVADKTRRVNAVLEELVGEIINADGTWQFDDTNLTDQPRGKGTLVEGQEEYTFASEYLQIEAVDILDTSNIYRRILPFDPQELDGQSPDEYFGVDSSGNPQIGFPECYDIKGDTIRLYPAPTATSVTLANGIRISFKRASHPFTATDTTAEPGLPSTHHILLAYMASIPYCATYKKDRVAWLEKKVVEMKKTLLEHYAYREKNRRGIIRPKRRSFK
jgi:hypothetical protein